MTGSWRTTAAGLVPFIGAGASLIAMATGASAPDGNLLMMDIGILGSGLIGFFAKDKNVSNSPTPIPVAKPVP
jgi:hypothetical protein